MKKLYFIFSLAICFISFPLIAQTAPSGIITYQKFYDDLAPYGTWMNYPGIGEVWHPDVNSTFRPYATNGYWENTDQGWYWESEYEWGWAPFHYGKWFYDDTYGWLWEPGYEWSPAWVTWGETGDYYAWAPLAPESILTTERNIPHDYYWNMVDKKNVYDKDLHNRLINESLVRQNANRITVENMNRNNQTNRQFYTTGPAVSDVKKYTNHTVPTRTIKDVNEPVKIENNQSVNRKATNNQIQSYRPTVQTMRPEVSHAVDINRTNIMRDNTSWPATNYQTQRENIRNLPSRENTGVRISPVVHENTMPGNNSFRNHR